MTPSENTPKIHETLDTHTNINSSRSRSDSGSGIDTGRLNFSEDVLKSSRPDVSNMDVIQKLAEDDFETGPDSVFRTT